MARELRVQPQLVPLNCKYPLLGLVWEMTPGWLGGVYFPVSVISPALGSTVETVHCYSNLLPAALLEDLSS